MQTIAAGELNACFFEVLDKVRANEKMGLKTGMEDTIGGLFASQPEQKPEERLLGIFGR